MIIGIDNGACSGAMCALTDKGEVMGYARLPSIKPKGRPTEINFKKLVDWVVDWGEPVELVAVEMPLSFARSVQAMRSMAMCYGHIEGLCKGRDWDHVGIGVREWQNAMLGYFAKGESKKAAYKVAHKLEPKIKWTTVGGKKPHDGIIDAYLIGLYATRKKL